MLNLSPPGSFAQHSQLPVGSLPMRGLIFMFATLLAGAIVIVIGFHP